MYNCVSHGSIAGSGVQIANAVTYSQVFFNRFTDNNQYGIEVVGAKDTTSWFNYNGFLGNGVGTILNGDAGIDDVVLGANGYVNEAGDDYTLADAAEQRRIEIELDWA